MYPWRSHSEVTASMISVHWVSFGCCQHQIVQIANRPDLWNGKGFDGEETTDDQNGEGMEVIGQEPIVHQS